MRECHQGEDDKGQEDGMRVKSVTRTGRREAVYDLEVPVVHNFSVNGGIIVHNCRYGMEPYITAELKPVRISMPKAFSRGGYGSNGVF